MGRVRTAARGGVWWRPLREQSWRLVFAAAALGAGAVVAASWESPWRWFTLALGLLLAVGGVALDVAQDRARTQDAQDDTVHRAARTADERGGLQRVRDVTDLELGVHRSHVQPRYVSRDREGDVRAALAASEPVLVLGDSMAGKTRMAAHIIQVDYPDQPIFVPSVPDGLATLVAEGALPGDAVVWLNDLERYLVGDGLKVEWLDRIRRGGNIVVATMRAQEFAKFQPTKDLRPPQREVLERFTEVWLKVDPAEQDRIAAEMPDRETREGVQRYGLAEYVGGGYLAVQRLRAGEATNPLGAAMVRAAADWRRAGLDAIPTTSMAALAPLYLPGRRRQDAGEDNNSAISWASEFVDGFVRLLEATADGYRAFDYIVDHISTTAPPIPDPTWRELVAVTPIQMAVAVGYRAYLVGELDHAAALWRRASEASDGYGSFNLALLRKEQGDFEAAADAYQAAIATHHPEAAPMAALNLAFLRKEQGDLEAAARALQIAIDSRHRDHAPMAAFCLGFVRWDQGDFEAASSAYQLAIDTHHPEASPMATFNLGILRGEKGDLDAAVDAYQLAIETQHVEATPAAAVNLAVLREKQEDLEAAADAYQVAIDTHHPDFAPRAVVHLGLLRERQGDLASAADAFQVAIDSQHVDATPAAALNLGLLCEEQGDLDAAADALQVAIDTYHVDHGPRAAFRLGILRREQGDLDAAADAFQVAIDSQHVEATPAAAVNLAVLRGEQGKLEAAADALQVAIDTQHVDHAPMAAARLGLLREWQGDFEAAGSAYQLAIAAHHPEASPIAAFSLGVLREKEGNLEAAADAYQLAIAAHDPALEAAAAARLRKLPLPPGA